ncbi:MAG: hypothetical protein ACM3U1_06575 [Chloroflexota bacterium]
MRLSDDTREILEALDAFSGGSLRKPEDLAIILEIAATYGELDPLNELIFSGKSAHSLYFMLKKSKMPESNENLVSEMDKSLANFEQALRRLAQYLEEEESIKRFDEKYFAGTQGARLNLLDLAHDFAIFKDLQIRMKSMRK